jgi:hypothetical protein
MPMRTVCADAVAIKPASNPATSGAANRLNFLIAFSPLDATSLQGPCQRRDVPIAAATGCLRAPGARVYGIACPQIGQEEMSPGVIVESRAGPEANCRKWLPVISAERNGSREAPGCIVRRPG